MKRWGFLYNILKLWLGPMTLKGSAIHGILHHGIFCNLYGHKFEVVFIHITCLTTKLQVLRKTTSLEL